MRLSVVACIMPWALVQVVAVPASRPDDVIDQGVVPGDPDFSDNNWAHNWHELMVDSAGPCIANTLTNCFCSSNFLEDECDNTTTPAAQATYGDYEDCYVVFAQPIDVFVPLFSTEARVTKWYGTTCSRYRWKECCWKCPRSSPGCKSLSDSIDVSWGRDIHPACDNGCGDCWQGLFKPRSKKQWGCKHKYLDEYDCQRSFLGGDSVIVDGYGRNAARDTHWFSGELTDNSINGIKATHIKWRSDRDGGEAGFKICAVNPFVNPGGHAPSGGSSIEGTVPPDDQACPCGTNPSGDHPGGNHENPVSEGSGDNCFSNPAWPCDRDVAQDQYRYSRVQDYDPDEEIGFGPDNYIESGLCHNRNGWSDRNSYDITNGDNCRAGLEFSEATLKDLAMQKGARKIGPPTLDPMYNTTDPSAFAAPPVSAHVTKWELDVRAALQKNNVKAHVACCKCRGGWIAGYDPQGDMATETELGEMTRGECILAAKAVAGANAASIDDTATETVTGTCYAETNAHYSPAGWTSGAPRQACLFGQ